MPVVVYLPEAERELSQLPAKERVAVANAVEKLEALGKQLGYPHSSAVREVADLRELRPRGGRSPWRAFYREVEGKFVVAAVGPEANHNRRRFDRAVYDAEDRLAKLEEE